MVRHPALRPLGLKPEGKKGRKWRGASKSAGDDACLDWPFAANQASYLEGATEHPMNPNSSLIDRAGLDRARVTS